MKKKNHYDGFGEQLPNLRKILMIMKLTSFLFLLGILNVMAEVTYSQATKVSLNLKGSTVEEVLNTIENNSEFYFLLNQKLVDVSRKVDVVAENKPIKDVLDKVFEGTDVTYCVLDRQIILYPKSETNAFAQMQQFAVSGKVTSASTGEPLPGVTVVVKGTTQGTITDTDGKYTIAGITPDAILVFSFVGLKTKEIAVGGQTQIDVAMEEEMIGIDEVVTVGYGSQKKTSVVGSVLKVSSEALENRSVTNVASALQGRAPGLLIRTTNGQPGNEEISLNIRGINSWGTSNSPLILIDGVPGDLRQISPEVIDNVSILKDALSGAIYGARAANGVILVTTKRGSVNKIQVTYNTIFSTQAPTKKYETINDPVEFMNLYNTAQRNTSGDPNYNVLYKPEDIALFQNGTFKGTNWDDFLFQKNLVQEHRINMSGGTENVKFNTGLSFTDQPGIIKNFGNKKYSYFGNFDLRVNDFISAGGGTVFTRGNLYEPSNGIQNIMILALDMKPTANPTYIDPETGETKIMVSRWKKEARNASVYDAVNFSGEHTIMTDIVNVQAFVNVTPFKGLVWQTKAAVYYTHDYNKHFTNSYSDEWAYVENIRSIIYDPANNTLNINQPWSQTTTLYSTLSYNHSFNRHNIGTMVGYEVDKNTSQTMSAYRRNFPSKELTELNAGGTTAWTNSGTSWEWGLQSYFGRFNYDFDGKYLLEGNLRYDQSSRFAPGLKAAVFPSVGIGWLVSKENFMQQIPLITNLKLRAAWGQLGNQEIGNYPYQATYNFGNDYYFGSLATGVVISGLVNKNLSWETTTVQNAGLDLSIKDGLFSLSFEYYNKLTTGILRSAQVMATTGLNAPIVNSGSMRNTGIELMLGHKKQVSSDFSYSIDLNIATNKNRVEKFGAKEIYSNMIIQEGYEYGAYYLLKMTGIYQENDPDIQNLKVDGVTQHAGQIKYEDVNGDGDITAADRQIVGHKFPRMNFGLNVAVHYRNFDFSAFIYGVQGYDGYQQYFGFEPFAQGGRPNVFWRKAWTPENKSNKVPQIYNVDDAGGNWYNSHPSTFFLCDLSFQRLKNIQLGYTIPESALKSMPIKSVRFYFSGDNLLSHFNNKDAMVDVETRQDNSYLNYRYPQLKTYSLGLLVKF